MKGYLLDTNHLSYAIRPVSPLRDRMRQAHRSGFRLITCWPVLCELQEGIVFTADPAHYERTLKAVTNEICIWTMDWALVEHYGSFTKIARKRARALSTTDMILVPVARKESAILLTADKDFEAFPEIKTENWITEEASPVRFRP